MISTCQPRRSMVPSPLSKSCGSGLIMGTGLTGNNGSSTVFTGMISFRIQVIFTTRLPPPPLSCRRHHRYCHHHYSCRYHDRLSHHRHGRHFCRHRCIRYHCHHHLLNLDLILIFVYTLWCSCCPILFTERTHQLWSLLISYWCQPWVRPGEEEMISLHDFSDTLTSFPLTRLAQRPWEIFSLL